MLRYDFQNGIVKRISWITLPLIVFTMCVFSVRSTVEFISDGGQATLGECLVFYLQGSIPAGSIIGNSIPNFYWLLIQLGCICFTIEYPTRDLNVFGQHIVVRSGSRIKWWMSKCLWIAESVLIYWLIGIAVTAAAAPFIGVDLSLEIKQSSVMCILNFCNVSFGEYSSEVGLVYLVIIPWLSMLVVNMICLLCGLLTNQIFALIFGLFVLFVPSMWMNPLIVTNYTMLQRCSLFYSNGLDFTKGIVYTSAFLALSIIAGAFIMQNMDIIEPKKNGE